MAIIYDEWSVGSQYNHYLIDVASKHKNFDFNTYIAAIDDTTHEN